MRYDDIDKSITLTEWRKLAKAFPPLQPHEETILAARSARGDQIAKDKLFRHNSSRILYFALSEGSPEARKASHKPHGAPWPTHDEVASWASEGLWWAVEHFTPGRIPFNQWANLCIRTLIWRMKAAQDRKEIKYLAAAASLLPPGDPRPDTEWEEDTYTPIADASQEMAYDYAMRIIEESLGLQSRRTLESLLRGDNPQELPPRFLEHVRETLLARLGEKVFEDIGRVLLA